MMSENKDESTIDIGDYVEYKIVTYKSAFGIVSWFFMVMLSFALLMGLFMFLKVNDLPEKKVSAILLIFLLLVGIFLFKVTVPRMNYVRLSKNFLVVKNNILKKQEFFYSNSYISEIILETKIAGNSSKDCITIVTNDLDSYSYTCNLFYRRTFFDLKNALIGYGINVTDKMNLTEREFKTFMHK